LVDLSLSICTDLISAASAGIEKFISPPNIFTLELVNLFTISNAVLAWRFEIHSSAAELILLAQLAAL